ncbi:hypothetical protein SAMN04487941_1315 [Pontibacter akesuensis]|uniref:Uncharacterized protein n=3 Tax=Pontibacter akesuensis TaxID=388950 RepID=A0A1I7GW97_9BACT|nr:hypothetical protein SAMN04487941_1315 [Pontibacter akesuensis]
MCYQQTNDMDRYPLKPEHMRAPEHLTKGEVQKSLDELDHKIKTLKGRLNATTADSSNNYQQHIEALEKKRALIAQKIGDSQNESQHWKDLHDNIGNLHNDADNMLK